jgi:hypothetical protein
MEEFRRRNINYSSSPRNPGHEVARGRVSTPWKKLRGYSDYHQSDYLSRFASNDNVNLTLASDETQQRGSVGEV